MILKENENEWNQYEGWEDPYHYQREEHPHQNKGGEVLRHMAVGAGIGEPRGVLGAVFSKVSSGLLATAHGVRITVRALGRDMPNTTLVAGAINGVLGGSPGELVARTPRGLVGIASTPTLVRRGRQWRRAGAVVGGGGKGLSRCNGGCGFPDHVVVISEKTVELLEGGGGLASKESGFESIVLLTKTGDDKHNKIFFFNRFTNSEGHRLVVEKATNLLMLYLVHGDKMLQIWWKEEACVRVHHWLTRQHGRDLVEVLRRWPCLPPGNLWELCDDFSAVEKAVIAAIDRSVVKIESCCLRSRMQDRCDKKQNKTRKCDLLEEQEDEEEVTSQTKTRRVIAKDNCPHATHGAGEGKRLKWAFMCVELCEQLSRGRQSKNSLIIPQSSKTMRTNVGTIPTTTI
ncbi:hypothetical protein LXL04_016333 [Taraxacum kok-saghyz]